MVLTQLLRISKQAGLLSKSIVGGTRAGSQVQDACLQLKLSTRYKSDNLITNSRVFMKLEAKHPHEATVDGYHAKSSRNTDISRSITRMESAPNGRWAIGHQPSGLENRIIKTTLYAPEQLIGLNLNKYNNLQQVRCFHAKGSKVKYLDFRYRFKTNHLRTHLLIIRRQKMKKHQKRKWRKKYKSVIAKMRLKREIAKEKTFRIELLTMIRKAEQFDPREYALKKIREINDKPKELTREERLEQLKQLIRENRYQVDYVKPKHRRIEVWRN